LVEKGERFYHRDNIWKNIDANQTIWTIVILM
jgi:hypothetical protein